MLLHAHFVLIRCVLDHLGVGREGMKRRQDCQPQARGGHTKAAIHQAFSRRPSMRFGIAACVQARSGTSSGSLMVPAHRLISPALGCTVPAIRCCTSTVFHIPTSSSATIQVSSIISPLAGREMIGPYSTSRRSDQRQPLKHNGRACARPLRSQCCYLRREPRITSAT